MTVLENLMVAQHAELMRASAFSVAGLLGLPSYRRAEAAAIGRARYWLERVDLVDRANQTADSLPYGQQRRLRSRGRSATKPRLLCLDEPAAGLNPRESLDLAQLIRAVAREHDLAILLIEHDMSVVMGISDHIVVLDYGRKIAEGSPSRNPERQRRSSPRIWASRRRKLPEAPMLEVEGVSAAYGAVRALDRVSLSVGKGEIVTLIGANGAGKTTDLSISHRRRWRRRSRKWATEDLRWSFGRRSFSTRYASTCLAWRIARRTIILTYSRAFRTGWRLRPRSRARSWPGRYQRCRWWIVTKWLQRAINPDTRLWQGLY